MKRLIYALGIFSLNANLVLAQDGSGTGAGISIPNPLSCEDARCLLVKIIDVLTKLAIPVVVFFVVWGGIKIIMSRGNKADIQAGRQMILNAVIGLVILLVADSVPFIIQDILGVK